MKSLGALLKREKSTTNRAKAGTLLSPLLHPFGRSTETSGEEDRLLANATEDRIRILAEIVGATDLVPHPSFRTTAVVTSSLLRGETRPASPGVVARWISPDESSATTTEKENIVHSTKPIYNCNNPIWTARTGSLFLLDVPLKELPASPGKKATDRNGGENPVETENCSNVAESALLFEVQDRNVTGTTLSIGSVRLSASNLSDILQSKSEQRLEFVLKDIPFGARSQEGTLALRFRLASEGDIRFIECLREGNIARLGEKEDRDQEDEGLKRIKTKLGIKNRRGDGIKTDKEKVVMGMIKTVFDPQKPVNFIRDTAELAANSTGAALKLIDKEDTRIRVKPGPDPLNPKETTFLSEDELLRTAYDPSTRWLEAGSGDLGRVYIEVLGCKDLPNVEAGGGAGALLVGDKTDAFVSIVFEDSIVMTETIDNSLSPLFMPWTQRAFAFNRMFPLSPAYLAVFDNNLGTAHMGIGRCVINLEAFKPGMMYTLEYALYSSSVVTDRDAKGTVTIRLRIETPDERKLLVACSDEVARKEMRWIYVNMRKEKSLSVARFTLTGKYDEEKFDLKLFLSYINELITCRRVIFFACGDVLRSIILWRGQVNVGELALPLHSMLAFLIGIYIVESLHLLPSLLCFSTAWFLIGSYTHRARHPSPWRRCRPITDYMRISLLGKASSYPVHIRAGEGAKETQALEDAWNKRVEDSLMAVKKEKEMKKDLLKMAGENIQTEQSDGAQITSINSLLEPKLSPVQERLRKICEFVRRFKCVLMWEDSSLSFCWTVMLVGLGVVFAVLPMAWLLHWLLRIAVWALLGPWMKLVDMYVPKGWLPIAFATEEERLEYQEAKMEKMTENFRKQAKEARKRREEAEKLRAVKSLMFGEYIAWVPPRNITRHFDYPLSNSTACPFSREMLRGWQDRMVDPGQQLLGKMIPRRAQSGTRSAGIADNTKKRYDMATAFKKVYAFGAKKKEKDQIMPGKNRKSYGTAA